MELKKRRFLFVLSGGAAALMVWPLMELILSFQGLFIRQSLFILSQGALMGALFGGTWGLFDGTAAGNRPRRVTGLVRGLLWGVPAGAAAFYLGQSLLLPLAALIPGADGTDPLASSLIRALSWTVMGLVIGLTDGIRTLAPRRFIIGAGGGITGGFLGGFALEMLRLSFPQFPLARGAGLILFGLILALSYALFQKRLAYGIIRVLNGSLQGREYILDQGRSLIGSKAGREIPLPDYGISAKAARLQPRGGEIWITPLEEDVKINTKPLEEEAPLKWEDTLQIGRAKLLFRPLT